jgi:hypothetical protein
MDASFVPNKLPPLIPVTRNGYRQPSLLEEMSQLGLSVGEMSVNNEDYNVDDD